MIKRFIAATLIALAGFTGINVASAGADPIACPVGDIDPNTGKPSGWYWHMDKVMQCVDDGWNMIVFQYGAGGVYEGVAFNAWVPYNIVTRWVYAGAPGVTSKIRFCAGPGYSWLGTRTPGPSGWEREFRYQHMTTPWITSSAGAINHFNGWAGIQAYGGVGVLNEGCLANSTATTVDFFPG